MFSTNVIGSHIKNFCCFFLSLSAWFFFFLLAPTEVSAASCGDGILEWTEECDYGPGDDSDGCNDSCEITLTPFVCNSDFYQVLNNQFVIVDVVNETYVPISSHSANLNSLWYNIEDNLIYANQWWKLVIIGSWGQFLPLGSIPWFASNYIGAFDASGNRYTAAWSNVWKIDVSERPLVAEAVATNFQSWEKIYGADMSYDSDLNAFIVHNSDGSTYAFHHLSGTIEYLGWPTVTKTFGAMRYDQATQIMYGGYNGSVQNGISWAIYHIDYLSGYYHHIMDMPPVGGNDATNCPLWWDPFESSTAKCQDGIDNDGDGISDCEDPSCHGVAICFECGNGRLEADEECDDGNRSNLDNCTNQCTHNQVRGEGECAGWWASWTGQSKLCVSNGDISLDEICNIDFGAITMSSNDQMLYGTMNCPIVVRDMKWADEGWWVTMEMGDLAISWAIVGGVPIPSTKLAMKQEEWDAEIHQGVWTKNIRTRKAKHDYINGSFWPGVTKTIIGRDAGTNNRQLWHYKTENLQFRLTIPAFTVAATYKGTITVTLMDYANY